MDRYIRNLQLEGFDETSQARLRTATVGVVGCGALGSVVAMYLAAAGVGRLRIADFDTVDLSNLQRQIFFCESEVGQPKVRLLAKKIKALNSEVKIDVLEGLITPHSAQNFISQCSVIAECSDNPPTKAMIVDTRKKTHIPVIVGGVREYVGQVAVFGSTDVSYTDVFPSPSCTGILPCSMSGVFSPVPGIVASIQASEILKIIAGITRPIENQLLTFDVRSMQFVKYDF